MKVVLCLFLAVAAVYAAPSERQILCGPVCMIYCPFGNVMDSKGCPTCACNWPTTQTVAAKRQLLKNCNFQQLALCDLWCPSGKMAHDANGCTICGCDNSGIILP